MNTPTVLSDCSSRHRHRKRGGSKRTHSVHSDHYEQQHAISPASSHTHISGGRVPRMAELETLEAKMANIEVSLSVTPRRRKSGSLAPVLLRPKETQQQQQQPQQIQQQQQQQQQQQIKDNEQLTSADESRAPNSNGLTGSNEGTIESLQTLLSEAVPLSDADRKVAEERAATLRTQVDAKRASIGNLKLKLDGLDITDNIDVRIRQAELEYRLGREELELLTLLEGERAARALLERDDRAKCGDRASLAGVATIFACVATPAGRRATLRAVQCEYSATSPLFGAGPAPGRGGGGLWIEWALDRTGMRKGDRLLEVNGKLVLAKSKEDMLRLLSISPSPAQIVVIRYEGPVADDMECQPFEAEPSMPQVGTLREELNLLREQAEETKRTKDGLRTDNIRLTHRISYLEEQVTELLGRNRNHHAEESNIPPQKLLTSTVKTQRNVTNISITSDPNPKAEVFQKVPDMKAIVTNHHPGSESSSKDFKEPNFNMPIIRPKSSLSNVSSTQIEIGKLDKGHHRGSTDFVDQKKLKLYSNLQSNHVHYNHKSLGGRYSLQPSKSSDVIPHSEDDVDLLKDKRQYALRQSTSHHAIYNNTKNFDYNTETSAALEIIKNNQRHYLEARKSKIQSDDNSDASHSLRRKSNKYSYGESTNSQDLKGQDVQSTPQFSFNDKWPHYHNAPTPNDEYGEFHPDRDYIDHRIDGKVIQNAHKINRRLGKAQNSKLSDCDSEPVKVSNGDRYRSGRSKVIDYTSEPNGYTKKSATQYLDRPRPLPPKKPIRLSLHRAQSMQTIEPEANHGEKFYLHQPTHPSSSNHNADLRYSSAKNIIDDMVGYNNKENRAAKPPPPDSSHSEKKLRHQSKHFSKSEELIEYQISLSDREHAVHSENKRIKKRLHEARSSTSDVTKNEYNNSSSRSESVASNHTNHTHYTNHSPISNKYSSKLSSNGSSSYKEDVIISGADKYEFPKSKGMNGGSENGEHHKTSNSIVSSFKWTHPTIFKNIRMESSSKQNGHVSKK